MSVLQVVQNGGVLAVGAVLAALAGSGGAKLLSPPEPEVVVVAPDQLPEAIRVNEITIQADGSAIYDREILVDNVALQWTGTVFKPDGSVHCNGGQLFTYRVSAPTRSRRTADWLVDDDCSGLEPGMRFVFAWSSPTGEYRPVLVSGTVLP